jgi:hypothetical protein
MLRTNASASRYVFLIVIYFEGVSSSVTTANWGGVYLVSGCPDTGWRQGSNAVVWRRIDELGASAQLISVMDSSICVILEVAFLAV